MAENPSDDLGAKKTLKNSLARFMDRGAFEPVENRIKHTCKEVGRAEHDKRKVRREIALKRADAAIRFFLKADNLASLNNRASLLARSKETDNG